MLKLLSSGSYVDYPPDKFILLKAIFLVAMAIGNRASEVSAMVHTGLNSLRLGHPISIPYALVFYSKPMVRQVSSRYYYLSPFKSPGIMPSKHLSSLSELIS